MLIESWFFEFTRIIQNTTGEQTYDKILFFFSYLNLNFPKKMIR